ncbi:type IV pilus assembly PilZ [Elusimicrobium minutum Pei191]|uniref:Type IV pilus assembly PilZ n=1 Tax=Elusimicrobium minutum (strain Pei191) TaxID=445932 RepID=B2KDS0_ELUMP|nr:PilZ domain-containing protein [Elusimicrobium minutum]ACC98666.1 type IV pilus assembly PilZ [Elusimicrobium minutum Pei191]
MQDKRVEKRRHARVPVLNNIVEPINLCYKTEEGKEQNILAVLADLSASGMRLISFLEAPFSKNVAITIDLPAIGKVDVKGKTSWVKQKNAIFTLGIEFTEISQADAAKINALAEDFADCDTRILLKLPEVCVSTCKAAPLCNKIQKDMTLFK